MLPSEAMKKGNMGGLCVLFHEKCNLEKGGNKYNGIWVVWVFCSGKMQSWERRKQAKANMGGVVFNTIEVQSLQRRKRANCEYGCLMYWTPTLFHCHPYSRFPVPFPPQKKKFCCLLLVYEYIQDWNCGGGGSESRIKWRTWGNRFPWGWREVQEACSLGSAIGGVGLFPRCLIVYH